MRRPHLPGASAHRMTRQPPALGSLAWVEGLVGRWGDLRARKRSEEDRPTVHGTDTALLQALLDRQALEGAPRAEVRRQHALEGILRRLAASPLRETFVLRGGVLLRVLCPRVPRPAQDLDLLSRERYDADSARAQVAAILALPCADGLRFGACEGQPIWTDRPFPGLRFQVAADVLGDALEVQLDVGFHDPIVPPPLLREIPGVTPTLAAEVLACSPETLFAWKVHGLYEREVGHWRPKDLHDAWLLAIHGLDASLLPAALSTAFESRGDSLSRTDRLVAGEMGRSKGSLKKWKKLRKTRSPGSVPETPEEAVQAVGALVGAARRALGS